MLRFVIPAMLILYVPAVSSAQDMPESPRVAVTGEGEATLRPDMAVLDLAVMREAETARAALDANNAAMADVIAAMKEAGIAGRDLQTSGLSINPRYAQPRDGDAGTPEIVAYQVANSLTVRVRDLSGLGRIIDRSVTLGVNQGGGISFTNDDPRPALTEARRRAVEDAMTRARTLADAAGVTLGGIIEISETSPETPRPLPVRAMRMEADSAVPVEAGENSYTVHVNVTFAIESEE